MIPQEILIEINRRLKQAEQEENVRILLAVESGSRAWGFASPKSDFDVRFIFVHPKDWYLSFDLEDRRDVIEYSIIDEIDLYGWDLRKALRLYWKSSPMFVEWLLSPITYIENGCFRQKACEILPEVYSLESGIYNFLNMAKTDYHKFFKDDKVPLKKYLYVLRSLLSIRWIEKNASAAPIEFDKLLDLLKEQKTLRNDIENLLSKKRNVSELGLSEPIESLSDYITKEFNRLAIVKPERLKRLEPLPILNELFATILNEGVKANS
jgi:predicted nucleotidyltransferase